MLASEILPGMRCTMKAWNGTVEVTVVETVAVVLFSGEEGTAYRVRLAGTDFTFNRLRLAEELKRKEPEDPAP